MNVRPALPTIDTDIFGEPVTDADWAAMSPEDRAHIQVGLDELDRGEFFTHEEVMAKIKLIRENRTR